MKTELQQYTVEQIVAGFVYNELEAKGLFGLAYIEKVNGEIVRITVPAPIEYN